MQTTIFQIDGETWRKSELRIKEDPTLHNYREEKIAYVLPQCKIILLDKIHNYVLRTAAWFTNKQHHVPMAKKIGPAAWIGLFSSDGTGRQNDRFDIYGSMATTYPEKSFLRERFDPESVVGNARKKRGGDPIRVSASLSRESMLHHIFIN